jgi:hypothetical protein
VIQYDAIYTNILDLGNGEFSADYRVIGRGSSSDWIGGGWIYGAGSTITYDGWLARRTQEGGSFPRSFKINYTGSFPGTDCTATSFVAVSETQLGIGSTNSCVNQLAFDSCWRLETID